MTVKEFMVNLAKQIATNDKYGYSNDWPNNRFGDDATPYDGDCGAFCSYVLNQGLKQIGINSSEYYEPQGGWDIYNEAYLLKYCDRYDYNNTRNECADILISGGHTVMITGVDPDYITHAANDYDGRSGDGNSQEIRTQRLYDGGWHYIYRLKDKYNKEIKEKETETTTVKVKVLREGDTGNEVKTLQCLLNLWTTQSGELYPIYTDGIFGPATAERLKLYQRLQGLEPDAVCGQKTWTDILN